MKELLEEWQKLCAQAVVEKDPKKLEELIRRIDELLADKHDRLNRVAAAKQPKSDAVRQS